jgi:hypothetical protein
MAPRARFELATLRLTAECSAVELPGNRCSVFPNLQQLRKRCQPTYSARFSCCGFVLYAGAWPH